MNTQSTPMNATAGSVDRTSSSQAKIALFRDETCFFLSVDVDKAGWREDATAFLETCRRL